MTEAELTDLLRKVAAGELTPEAATRQIQSPPKKRGRPPAPLGESRMGMVWVFYILFDVHHLKMMDLRGLLAEAWHVDESVIGKAIAQVRRVINDPRYFTGYATVNGRFVVIGTTMNEIFPTKHSLCQTLVTLPDGTTCTLPGV